MHLLPAHSVTQTRRLLHSWTQKNGSDPTDAVNHDVLIGLASRGRAFAKAHPNGHGSGVVRDLEDAVYHLMRSLPYAMDNGFGISAFCLGVMDELTTGHGKLPSGYSHWASIHLQHELAAAWLMASHKTRARIESFAETTACKHIDWSATKSGILALAATVQAAQLAGLTACLPLVIEDLRDKIDLLVFDDTDSPIGLALQIKRWRKEKIALAVIKHRDAPNPDGERVTALWDGMGFFNPKNNVNFAPVVMCLGQAAFHGEVHESSVMSAWSRMLVDALAEARDI